MNSVLVPTIICPKCHAELSAKAEICPRCGSSLRAEPASSSTPAGSSKRILDRPWLIVVVLLHVGLLGIPLYWSTKYSTGVRMLICILSVVYTVFAVAVIVWGFMQIFRAFA